MKIGIPKAFFYFRYGVFWESFFDALDIKCIVSPDTNKEILTKGYSYAVDESCLSSKIYLGHVAWLIGKCDCILVPRISGYGKAGIVCTKYQAIYDLVKNTFRSQQIKLLHYNIDIMNTANELKAFYKLGRSLGKKRQQVLLAYLSGKQAERNTQQEAEQTQQLLLNEKKIKILLVAHGYNIYDKYVGEPIISALKSMDVVPVIADIASKKEALACSYQISDTLPWVFNKELLGAIVMFRGKIDGIILMSTFPCGPDSLVNEVVIRRVSDKPILNLILDGQEGTAGLETRLESFVDIIKFKREEAIG